MAIKIKKKTKRKKIVIKLSSAEKAIQNEQRAQEKEIITVLGNIGFQRISGIEGKEVVYDGRKTEMDDIFVYENVVLVIEYTIGDPGKHLLNKKIFRVNLLDGISNLYTHILNLLLYQYYCYSIYLKSNSTDTFFCCGYWGHAPVAM